MDALYDFLDWAWARHHNPLSWYVRPLFILPFCYFAYKKSLWGITLTIVAVISSMFWFPPPTATDPRAAEFLAMERQYLAAPWTSNKAFMTILIPCWFVVLAWAFWRRSWFVGLSVIAGGTLLKVIWSFYFGGDSAWAIVPPVALGMIACMGVLLYAYRRVQQPPARMAD
jgi:hypothetical protein